MPTRTILVVEDEPVLADMLAVGLQLRGFEVDTCATAEEALQAVVGRAYDLALIDLMLPKIHGLELARRFGRLRPGIRIVLTSAYPLSEHQLVLADCGAAGFILKPYRLDRLSRLLERTLQGVPPRSEGPEPPVE